MPIRIFSIPNVKNEAAFVEFIQKKINAQLPDHLIDQNLFELLKTYLVYTHSKTWWKYSKNKSRLSYGPYFIENTIIAK